MKRAKYPKIGNKYVGFQGYGAIGVKHTVSSVVSTINNRNIVATSTGYMFGGQKLNIVNYSGESRNLSFDNSSVEWLSSNRFTLIVDIDGTRHNASLIWNEMSLMWEATILDWNVSG